MSVIRQPADEQTSVSSSKKFNDQVSNCTVLFMLTFCNRSKGQTTKLEKQIAELIKGFHGEIGVYVHDLKHDRIVGINADTVFPTASIVKISILIGIMDKIRKGRAGLSSTITVH
jgi:beta-lactamase class A